MKRILVVSQQNACRSQMAEGWLKYYGSGVAQIDSVGVVPTQLDLYAANAMTEAVIDISRYRAKGVNQVAGNEYDYVIILSDDIKHVLPVFKGNPRVYEYPFPNVAQLELEEDAKKKAYADLRDELENFCFDFIHQKIKPLM
ncbi:MAG: arsenate reductase ArsC [Bacteroidales bacterium]|nr:arsenate reductase ArsC [Bacteroidales bacterium]MDD4673648.1 arsenate reductase ArsC [Bacteroidales bacterium]MDY0348661.1 arsenate reductase ArsC [Tenuifilaceae bacterium]